MIWRSNELIVVVRKETYETHYLISLSGQVVKRLEWSAYGFEDDLYKTARTVEGGKLIERSTVEGPYHPLIVNEEKVLATGLQPASDEATRQLVERALGRAKATAEEVRLQKEREVAERLAAIGRRRERLGAGPIVDRAQDALIKRISVWADGDATVLLRTLFKLAEAKASTEVLQAYARGCLAASFEDNLPPLPEAIAKTPNEALAKELKERVRELEGLADSQERADANRNASALWIAAKSIAMAAEAFE